MFDKLNEIEKESLAALAAIEDESALDAWRVANIGRSSPVMNVFSQMGSLSKEERPLVGQRANQVKMALEKFFAEKQEALKAAVLAKSLATEKLDVTLPGRPFRHGRLHPATTNLRRILSILAEMGFQVYTARDVESDEFNFQLLNIPPHHPAREMQDTFYIDSKIEDGAYSTVLRTHTSPGQIRAMREFSATNPENPPSIRVALPGMVYRFEQISTRSEMQFYQVEGLAVGENITLSDLKGTLIEFARRMFGQNARFRFRADHFPFTEPSAPARRHARCAWRGFAQKTTAPGLAGLIGEVTL